MVRAPAYGFKLPELVGSRSSALRLTAELPSSLETLIVAVDCSAVLSASQGFVDELCKQILEERRAEELQLLYPSERMAIHAQRAAELRNLEGLVVLGRPEL